MTQLTSEVTAAHTARGDAAGEGGAILAPCRHNLLDGLVLALTLPLEEHPRVGGHAADDLATGLVLAW